MVACGSPKPSMGVRISLPVQDGGHRLNGIKAPGCEPGDYGIILRWSPQKSKEVIVSAPRIYNED
jgi:hypothetical protein